MVKIVTVRYVFPIVQFSLRDGTKAAHWSLIMPDIFYKVM